VPIYRLRDEIAFPDPTMAEPEGLLAVGGDLAPQRILTAYSFGIFPWYSEGDPILWWSPDPRLILEPGRMHVSKSLAKTIRRGRYRVTADTAFEEVIDRCAAKARADQAGTWITDDMRAAYVRLHELGFVHSIEAWDEEGLAGGLYGLCLGGTFFGESMFADRTDASKVAFARLVARLHHWEFDLVDCQVDTEHLRRFGARNIARVAFLLRLESSVGKPTRRGPWTGVID